MNRTLLGVLRSHFDRGLVQSYASFGDTVCPVALHCGERALKRVR